MAALNKFCVGPRPISVGANVARRLPPRQVKVRRRGPGARPLPRLGRPNFLATFAPTRHLRALKLPLRLPTPTHLDMWDHLQAQPHMAYGLKYCRLSRRVRKILRNRYRYSKYFFMVPPAKRLAVTLHL